jgi:hypothetical protein
MKNIKCKIIFAWKKCIDFTKAYINYDSANMKFACLLCIISD